jgi:hypothetical protein
MCSKGANWQFSFSKSFSLFVGTWVGTYLNLVTLQGGSEHLQSFIVSLKSGMFCVYIILYIVAFFEIRDVFSLAHRINNSEKPK